MDAVIPFASSQPKKNQEKRRLGGGADRFDSEFYLRRPFPPLSSNIFIIFAASIVLKANCGVEKFDNKANGGRKMTAFLLQWRYALRQNLP